MAVYEMPAEVMTLLVAGHLDILFHGEQVEGCCPWCCGPCWALSRLLRLDQLDGLVRDHVTGPSGQRYWWDYGNDRVDREWLSRAWRMTACHEGTT